MLRSDKMKCKDCQRLGKASKIYPGIGITTAMYAAPFYDEHGGYHNHDPNTTKTSYRCSEGHHWTGTSRAPCPMNGCSREGIDKS